MNKRKYLIGLCIIFLSNISFAKDVHINGYYKKNGTYVSPHYRSSPDHNFYNNWSTKGNINPYTGKEGTLINPQDNYNHYQKSYPSNMYKNQKIQNYNFQKNNEQEEELLFDKSGL